MLCALCGLIPLSAAATEEARQITELNAANPAEARSLTLQPGIDPIQIGDVPQTPAGRPRRDDGQGRLLWTTTDQNAIAEHVAISESGEWVAIGYTLNDERLEVRNAADGALVFSYPVESGGSWVAVSRDGGIIAYAALDSVWLFRRDGGGAPFFRFGMNGYAPGPVALSPGGTYLVATGNDPDGRTNRVWGFRSNDRRLLWTFEADAREVFGWYGATIAGDESVVAVNGKLHLYVLNLAGGELIWDAPTYNTESATALSADGRLLVTASLAGRVRLFARAQRGYEELWHYSFRAAFGSWVNSCAISADGRTVAAGTLDFYEDHYEGRLALFDAFGAGQPLWISDPLADEVAAISLSADGGIVAAASWGDIEHQLPDLVMHERHNRQPFYRLSTQGSLNSVGISSDGRRVVVGGKGTHNRVFGRGGLTHVIEATLLGGLVEGTVRDARGAAITGVGLSVGQNPYRATTDAAGRYVLRVEARERRLVTVTAHRPGFTDGARGNIEVNPGGRLQGVDFRLDPADPAPQDLRASQGMRNQIVLNWRPYNGRRAPRGAPCDPLVRSAVGDSPEQISPTPWIERLPQHQRRDGSDEADSVRIYRSPVTTGPYIRVGAVAGDSGRFNDRAGIIPQHRYYYVVTADFGDGESAYSAETVGWLDDGFLIFDADLRAMPRLPQLDGAIENAEWEGAVARDISDVLGYDAPDTAGTVTARIGFSNADARLYLAFSYFGRRTLQERMGVGIYVDDDGDGRWSVRRPASEGNYWGYWREGGPDMRYRSLTGGPFGVDPYYRFQNPTLAFSDARGYVEIEMAIPLGFHGPEEIALFAPDYTVGLGLFAMQRDQAGDPIFNGWWPQDVVSIVTEPQQFARVHITATLVVPPLAPTDLAVERDGRDLFLTWADPANGVDSARLARWDGVHIYRNGEFLAAVRPGRRQFLDEAVHRGGWYGYSLAGYIMENNRPFEGPLCGTVGAYAGGDPEVREFRYDDGVPEAYYVVAFDDQDNRWATRFEVEGEGAEAAVYWVDFYHRDADPIDVYCLDASGQRPGEMMGGRFRASPTEAVGFYRFHFPGVDQPRVPLDPDWGSGSVWVVLNYLADSPGAPAIGVDASAPDGERNLYYTPAGGWQSFGPGQPMIRIAVGSPPAAAPGDVAPALLQTFRVLANYPNPFNGRTLMPVELPWSAPVTVILSDLAGRVVWTQSRGDLAAGRHLIPLQAEGLGTGVYFARVVAGGRELHQVIHILK